MAENDNNPAEENLETEQQTGADEAIDAVDATLETPSAEDQLEAAQTEILELKDQMLRVQADAQNIKRRCEQDIDKARKFALEKFASELLPVVDNLERALQTGGEAESASVLVEGVELTRKSLVDVLAKFNIEQVDPLGAPFDPQLHEAMAMVPAPDAEPNSVIDVMQKGYTLNGRLLRAAMVAVAKAA